MILYKKQKGFSLIEVMMTLLVLSLILVLMAPFMTKTFKKFMQDGVVFEYNDAFYVKEKSEDTYCYDGVAIQNSSTWSPISGSSFFGGTTDGGRCSEYEFTVPNGVTSLDLTLVAGGGGGEGASGMIYWEDKVFLEKNYEDFYTDSIKEFDVFSIKKDLIQIKNLKNLVINFMTAEGQPSKMLNCGWQSSKDNGTENSSKYCYPYSIDNRENNPDGILSVNGVTWSELFTADKNIVDNLNASSNEKIRYGVLEYPNNYSPYYAIKTGKGGTSSPAIYNYEVPKYMYRKTSLNDINDGKKDNLTLNFKSSAKDTQGIIKPSDYGETSYYIDPNTEYDYTYHFDSNGKYVQTERKLGNGNGGKSIVLADLKIGDQKTTYVVSRLGEMNENGVFIDEKIYSDDKSIGSNNVLDRVKGMNGQNSFWKFGSKWELILNNIDKNAKFLGGLGGNLKDFGLGNCGAGANGYEFRYDKDAPEGSKYIYNPSLKGGPACIMATATYIPPTTNEVTANSSDVTGLDVKPGGHGGSGGTAVKIVNFKVTPGEKYVIYVGKGGTGGAPGLDLYVKKGENVDLSAGNAGESGTSTSIWRKNSDGTQTLVYMVTGGVGGSKFGSGITPHKLVSVDQNLLQNAVLDESIGRKIKDANRFSEIYRRTDDSHSRITYYYSVAVEQAYLSKRPFNFLNYANFENYSTRCATGGDTSGTNTCSTGYNSYNTEENPTLTFYSVKPNKNNTVNAYDGLFYKTYSISGGAAYVGGLGGFSGLGTKAGCGGMFMGNSRGIVEQSGEIIDDDAQSEMLINKIISPINRNFGEDKNYIYDIFEYYDNCNINTPDGQSAEYISPNPRTHYLGQAGSGGGGGGYTIDKGPGRGGDGQNGYLMIEWRK